MRPSPVAIFLVLGIVLRCVALNQPLVDAHLFRQTQTADAVRSLINASHWELSAHASWLGDLGARLVQELPIYNFIVAALYAQIGHLDLSGKIVTVAMWAGSFVCLQPIWRRILTPQQTHWANLLYVVSPLSIFFGQAFMPEMLIRLCEFAFLAALLIYLETGRVGMFLTMAFAGLVGMLVKTPEFSHLYIAAGLLVLQRKGWKGLLRPRYWIVLIVTAASVKGWAAYVDVVNARDFPEWTAKSSAQGFLGSWRDRFKLYPYMKYAGYLGAFAATPLGLLVASYGAARVIRTFRNHHILIAWGISLVAFYAFWGPRTAGEHSYYHLPAMGVLSALFAIGAQHLTEWVGRWRGPAFPRVTAGLIAAGVIGAAIIGTIYLFKPDRRIYAASIWVRDHVPKDEFVLFRMNHRPEMDYGQAPVMSYYAERDAWVYSPSMSPERRARALQTSTWAVVIHKSPETSADRWRRKLRGGEAAFQPADVSWLETQERFVRFLETPEFTVYRRAAPPRA